MIPFSEHAGIQYGVCETSDLDEMATLLADTFSRFDPPAVAVGITLKEFEEFVQIFSSSVASDGLTIVARVAETGEMVGALFTEDAITQLPIGIDHISKKFNPIFYILDQLGTEYWQDKELNPREYIHLFLLGVARSFTGRGIAQQLVRVCLKNGMQKGYRVGVTEATNNASQHIFRKLGFIERVQHSYQDYRYKGKAVFASINGHIGPMLMDKPLISL